MQYSGDVSIMWKVKSHKPARVLTLAILHLRLVGNMMSLENEIPGVCATL